MKEIDKAAIKKFIIKEFLYGKGDLSYSESLFEAGIIDSLGLLKLLAFIEKTFGIFVDMSEVAIANFDSIDRITQLIEKKRQKISK